MKLYRALLIILIAALAGCSSVKEVAIGPKPGEAWRGVHLLGYSNDDDLAELGAMVPKLAEMGINVIVLEVDYSFEFQSHPELRQGEKQITKEGARKFAQICRDNNIRLIPEFQSLGHQSWAELLGRIAELLPYR